jgi:hypothetical protein
MEKLLFYYKDLKFAARARMATDFILEVVWRSSADIIA